MKAHNLPSLRRAKAQKGFALTTELVLLSTVSVLGLTVGLVTMRDALTAEMNDVAEAVGALNQSYAFTGMTNEVESAVVNGSVWIDAADLTAGDQAAWEFQTPSLDEAHDIEAFAGGAPSTGASGPENAAALDTGA